MTKEQKLYELSKELVYQITGNYTEDVQDSYFQIAYTYLNKAMDFIYCCKIDSELLSCPECDSEQVTMHSKTGSRHCLMCGISWAK